MATRAAERHSVVCGRVSSVPTGFSGRQGGRVAATSCGGKGGTVCVGTASTSANPGGARPCPAWFGSTSTRQAGETRIAVPGVSLLRVYGAATTSVATV